MKIYDMFPKDGHGMVVLFYHYWIFHSFMTMIEHRIKVPIFAQVLVLFLMSLNDMAVLDGGICPFGSCGRQLCPMLAVLRIGKAVLLLVSSEPLFCAVSWSLGITSCNPP